MGILNANGEYTPRTLLSARERRSGGARLALGLATAFFGLLALAALLPLAWMALASVRPAAETFTFPATLLPRHWDFSPWRSVLTGSTFLRQLGNSLAAAALAVAGQLVISALAAYSLSKLRPRGRRLVLMLMLASLLIPFETVAIPLFLQMRAFPLGSQALPSVNLLSTYWGLVLPFFVSAFNIYVLKNFFDRLPQDLIHAARVDGASELRIFLTVVLPLSRPILAILGVFSLIGVWNAFFWPLIALNDPDSYTLMLGVQKMIEGGEPWNVVMASVTLVTAPTVLVFLLLQRWILRGVALTGMQG